ncbi:MAG TPA: S-layer homology domain-containing protein [Thermoanaerobaculia bacterium]
MRVRAAIALSILSLAAARAARAEDSAFRSPAPGSAVVAGEPEPTYGTASLTVHLIPSSSFTPRISSTTYLPGNGLERYITTDGATMAAPALLPSGARVERLELRACDSDPAREVEVVIGTCSVPGDFCDGAAAVATGVAGVPGCNYFGTNLAAPFTVNNASAPILVQITTGPNPTTTFSAVKIFYRLQVSPQPLVASFPVDVPVGHPFFRWVEALAAAGITSGCAPGAFCPDQPVTRGQMAVFLAAALGLHFPN